MKIEDYWYDAIEYYVSFETSKGLIIRRHLILPTDTSKKKIEKIVKNKFYSVEKVLKIEEISEVLVMK